MVPSVRKRKRRPGDSSKAVAYLRVSTSEQCLDAQKDAIEAWAARGGIEVVAWCEDHGVSGAAALDERDGFLEALASLEEARAGLLVVAKHDRLARDVMLDAMARALIERHGAQVVSADGAGNGDGPGEVMLRQMLAVFAQYERAIIKARTSAGLRSKRRRGVTYTRIPPYGYRNIGKDQPLEPVPEEQDILVRMLELRRGGKSIRAVMAVLNEEGRMQRNGKPWQLAQVQRLLKREMG